MAGPDSVSLAGFGITVHDGEASTKSLSGATIVAHVKATPLLE
jgi:hypothetical protein